MRAGGPSALLCSGGWLRVAAFGNVAAQCQGPVIAAEWLADHSDSSDTELFTYKQLAEHNSAGQTKQWDDGGPIGLTFPVLLHSAKEQLAHCLA